jgi:hypothetical protein
MFFTFLANKIEMQWPYHSAAEFRMRNQTRLTL